MGATDEEVAAVRAFNRAYTPVIGVLDEGMVDSPWTLPEARVVYELATAGGTLAVADLRGRLDLDRGWVSRLLAKLEGDGLLVRAVDPADARRQVATLTPAGERAFAHLDARTVAAVRGLLDPLGADARRRLVAAMGTVAEVLALDGGPAPQPVVLRPPEPGDLGWVVERHGAVYAREFGWDVTFELVVAEIVTTVPSVPDPRREAVWIAEVDGRRAGCVMCLRGDDDRTARLRLLLVEPWARGRGVGGALVDACTRFARRAGYERMVLWTMHVLADARRLYERAGFRLVDEEPVQQFGHALRSQTWELDLS